ncbi:MAG: glycosyltransferase [Bacteroidetes bacterium]|nr:glycosyltransferase [Bacteroidota bacterium]
MNIPVSIVTINYNNGPGLQKTIESVKAQSLSCYEFIVVDGGSNDSSPGIIKSNLDIISYWLSEKDNGIYHAMNKGARKASAEYIMFLNSGDVFAHESVLANVLPSLQADIVYGNITALDSRGIKTHLKSFDEASIHNLWVSTIWHPTAFTRKSLFIKNGFFNESFRLAGDYEFFVRNIIKHDATTKYINQQITAFDMGGASNKQDNKYLLDQERKLAWKLNFSDPLIFLFENYVRMLRSSEYQWGKRISRFLPL